MQCTATTVLCEYRGDGEYPRGSECPECSVVYSVVWCSGMVYVVVQYTAVCLLRGVVRVY